MAEEQTAQGKDEPQEVMLRVMAQYIKDLSFENPNAPDSIRGGQAAPNIDLNIQVKADSKPDDLMEVVLMVTARAMRGDEVAFIAELQYAGLFQFGADVAPHMMEPLVLIECPRMLFPFARQIVSDMTQQGGFPPLMLEPLDFAAMYRDQMARRQAAADESQDATVN